MTGKTDNEAAAAETLSGGTARLKGSIDKLAIKLNHAIDLFVATDHGVEEVEKVARITYALARACVGVQAAQAAEDRAQERAVERSARQAAAAVRARYNPDEGDETEMDEPARDPREVSEELDRNISRIEGWLDLKGGARKPDQRGTGEGVRPVAVQGAGGAASAVPH